MLERVGISFLCLRRRLGGLASIRFCLLRSFLAIPPILVGVTLSATVQGIRIDFPRAVPNRLLPVSEMRNQLRIGNHGKVHSTVIGYREPDFPVVLPVGRQRL